MAIFPLEIKNKYIQAKWYTGIKNLKIHLIFLST